MKDIICTICPRGCKLQVEGKDGELMVSNNGCRRGIEYGINEVTAPRRWITTTVKMIHDQYKRLPVSSHKAVPKELMFKIMNEINQIIVHPPIHIGDIIIENVLNTGCDIIATRSIH